MGSELTLSDVIASLLAKELKRDSTKRGSSNGTAHTLFASKQKFNKNFKKPGSNATLSSTSAARKKGTWIPGHYVRKCRKKTASEPRRPAVPESNLATVNSSKTKPTVLVSCANMPSNSSSEWFLDSGATHHVCNDKHMFQELDLYTVPQQLTVGNDSSCPILSSGTVKLITSRGGVVILPTVLYSPKMSKNLIFVSKVLTTLGML